MAGKSEFNGYEDSVGATPPQRLDFDDLLGDVAFDEIYNFDFTGQPQEETLLPDAALMEAYLQEEIEAAPQEEAQAQQLDELPQLAEEEKASSAFAPLFDMVADFGESIAGAFARIGARAKRAVKKPIRFVVAIFRALWAAIDGLLLRSAHGFVREAKTLRKEIRSAFIYMREFRRQPGTLLRLFWGYLKRALVLHKRLFRNMLNYALPVVAIVVLLATVNYWGNMTFALQVTYNDHAIGYIADESVYMEAQELARERIETAKVSTDEEVLSKPTYSLALVTLNQINDATAICDQIIENADSNLTNACGIYIDGDFVCSVKNRSDAVNVFNALLEPYKTEEENTFVDFVEEIEYIQGLYPDSEETMWDAAQLKAKLQENKEEPTYYTVKDGDTVYDIAIAHNLSESKLRAMNPNMGKYIHAKDKLLVSSEVDFIRVKVMRTETRKVEVDFEVQKTSNPSIFKGDTVTRREGTKGEEVITEVVTYINGERSSVQEISRVRTKDPIAKKVDVGTKSTRVSSKDGGSYNVTISQGGWVWPAPSCHVVSSPYGRRGRGWHTGVDLCRSGGGSKNTPVVASRDGTVELVQRSSSGYGHQILINHGNGLKTRYAHLVSGSIGVSVGQRVSAGQIIGRVGSTGNSTGPHLHFEIIVNGSTVNPLKYIK